MTEGERGMTEGERVHGTAVALEGMAVLLIGRPGSGKSDLALRLIDRGALLIADDQTVLRRAGGDLLASAPAALARKIELRGIGIVACPASAPAPLRLAVSLDQTPERLPHPETRVWQGVSVPQLRLRPFEPSAAIKLEWALRRLMDALGDGRAD